MCELEICCISWSLHSCVHTHSIPHLVAPRRRWCGCPRARNSSNFELNSKMNYGEGRSAAGSGPSQTATDWRTLKLQARGTMKEEEIMHDATSRADSHNHVHAPSSSSAGCNASHSEQLPRLLPARRVPGSVEAHIHSLAKERALKALEESVLDVSASTSFECLPREGSLTRMCRAVDFSGPTPRAQAHEPLILCARASARAPFRMRTCLDQTLVL